MFGILGKKPYKIILKFEHTSILISESERNGSEKN